jgi:hypothetical protein
MSESQEPRAALLTPEDPGTIMALLNLNHDGMGSEQTSEAFVQDQEVMTRIAQYSQTVRTIQAVCDHPQQMIALQKQITNLQAKQFLPSPSCDHSAYDQEIKRLKDDLDEARRIPRTAGTDEKIRRELEDMTRDAWKASTGNASLRTQLASVLSLASWVVPIPPQGQEERGQKFPDSPDFSGSDRSLLRGSIARLRMVIRHKPSSFPDEQSKMRYAFNRLSGIALRQIFPHVRENGVIRLANLSALIQLLDADFGDPDWVAMAERNMRAIKQKNWEFSQYYAEFQVSAADLDWNPSALRNSLRSGLSDEMKDSIIHTDMPEDLPAFLTLCQKRDNQIRQRKAEIAAQHKWTPPSTTKPPPPPPASRAPEAAPAGTVAGYNGPAPMDLGAGRRKLSDEERQKRLAKGRCAYYVGFSHRAVDSAVRKNARTFRVAGVEVEEGEDRTEGKGKGQVD